MSVAKATLGELPRLVFFHSALSGNCRRVEGFLAQVLQRRRNHGTFNVVRVAEEEAPAMGVDLTGQAERRKVGSAITVWPN